MSDLVEGILDAMIWHCTGGSYEGYGWGLCTTKLAVDCSITWEQEKAGDLCGRACHEGEWFGDCDIAPEDHPNWEKYARE